MGYRHNSRCKRLKNKVTIELKSWTQKEDMIMKSLNKARLRSSHFI